MGERGRIPMVGDREERCSQCGAVLYPEDRFCGECGERRREKHPAKDEIREPEAETVVFEEVEAVPEIQPIELEEMEGGSVSREVGKEGPDGKKRPGLLEEKEKAPSKGPRKLLFRRVWVCGGAAVLLVLCLGVVFFWWQRTHQPRYYFEKADGMWNRSPQDCSRASEAIKEYEKAAKKGHAEAQFRLGDIYFKGLCTTTNLDTGFVWYREAARRGHTNAQNMVGVCYGKGLGTTKNLEEAQRWFREAASKGDARGQYNLGYLYYSGEGVARDFTEARNWFYQASKEGLPEADYFLGYIYQTGKGVPRDLNRAVIYYRRAAQGGDVTAREELRKMGLGW